MSDPLRIYHPNLVITTARLVLRDTDLSEECCAAIYRIRRRPEVCRTSPNSPPDNLKHTKTWLADRLSQPNKFQFVIELRRTADSSGPNASRAIIGWCGGNRTPEFGYGIDPDFWGKGYATEAMRAVIDAFWDTWPNGMPSIPKERRDEVVVKVLPGNPASQAVARKIGFHEAGHEILPDNGSPMAKAKVTVFKMQRPPRDRSRAYEKLESVGPNLSEGPAL